MLFGFRSNIITWCNVSISQVASLWRLRLSADHLVDHNFKNRQAVFEFRDRVDGALFLAKEASLLRHACKVLVACSEMSSNSIQPAVG